MRHSAFEGEVEAHLTALTFLVEIAYANGFRDMPAADLDEFVAKVKRVSRQSWSPDPAADIKLASRSTEIIAHVIDAAAARARGD